jgi:hypothetical protein
MTNATLVSEPSSKLINCEQMRLFARDKDSIRDKDKEVSPKQIADDTVWYDIAEKSRNRLLQLANWHP